VITGVGGRRSWLREDKARIVADSFAAGANVLAVARRYGLRPQQVYACRLARNGALVLPAEEEVGFVPVIAAGGEAAPATPSRARIVEIEVAGTTIRAAPGVDWRFLREVLRAVKAAM
jgi:transposase